METLRRYEIEGFVLKIPLIYDEQSKIYIEDYREFIENVVHTPKGHKILFAGEDACQHAKPLNDDGCPDCGSCKFYQRAGDHTWIGICKCDERKNIFRQNE